MAAAKKISIRWGISKISLIKSNFNIPKDLPLISEIQSLKSNGFKYSFSCSAEDIPEKAVIQIVINYSFIYNENSIFEIETENDFSIINSNNLFEKEAIKDKNLVIHLIEVALSQTRGLQASIIKDTPIEKFYIPPISKEKIRNSIRSKNDKNSN